MRRDEEDYLYQLLMNGEVDKFNSIRMQTDYPYLSFDRRRFKSSDGDRILNLSAVNFKNVGLFRSKFIKCNLEVSDLSDTIIRESILKDVNLSDSIMIDTKLNEAHLSNVVLSGGVLTNTDLSYCVCENVDFSYANLANADLRGGHLSGVNFYSANLAGTDLRDTNMVDADLTLCDLSYATYSRRTLGTAKSLRDTTFVTIASHNKYAELCENVLTIDKVRFTAIYNNRREISYSRQHDGVTLKISTAEKAILLHVSWLTWRLLEQIEKYIGKLWYVIEQYEGLKLIEVPLTKTEIMFISTEIDSDHYSILKYVRENIANAHDARVDELKPPSSQSSSMITHFKLGFPDIIDYDEACCKIYAINGVILANIYDLNSSLTDKFCINIQSNNSHILGREGMRISIRNAWRVWKIRKKFESKIGRGICAVAEYDAVRRMTIPLSNSAILFIIMRKDIDPFKLLHEIRDILNKDKKKEDGK